MVALLIREYTTIKKICGKRLTLTKDPRIHLLETIDYGTKHAYSRINHTLSVSNL